MLLLTLTLLAVNVFYGQTIEELKAQKAEKEAVLGKLKGEVAAIDAKIAAMPGWKTGAFGTIGLNFSNFNNWFSKGSPNTSASTIGFTGNAFANLMEEKFFWRNTGNLNLAWVKFDDKDDDTDNDDFQQSADALNITSLYGQKLSDKIAFSGLGEYRTTPLSNFNNPGYLDIGVGATWTPTADMVVVFHPLNYNFVFSDDEFHYDSSAGCKIVADYAKALPMGVSWKTNLSAFLSYGDMDNLSNWTWINGLGLTVWKGLGVGLEFGLRKNKQEGYNDKLAGNDTLNPDIFKIEDLESDDNPLQTYWLLGFTYSL